MNDCNYIYNLLIIRVITTACRLLPLSLRGTHRRSNLGKQENLSIHTIVGDWISSSWLWGRVDRWRIHGGRGDSPCEISELGASENIYR